MTMVAPPAGAWIETLKGVANYIIFDVAPPAGAWIETRLRHGVQGLRRVAPPAGAWIETQQQVSDERDMQRRAPRGRVD